MFFSLSCIIQIVNVRPALTLSWRRPLLCKSMDWFLYDNASVMKELKGSYVPSAVFKMKLQIRVFLAKAKTNLHFALRFVEGSNCSFSVHLMNHRIIKFMVAWTIIRSSKDSVFTNFCIFYLYFFPVSIIKTEEVFAKPPTSVSKKVVLNKRKGR